ncbi:hypothetical protein LPS07_05510 [Acinetobacter pittii]|uniref:hypothetical protein n=1 Tax=Acinetobacter pittii TaxID=48296 RepID=UPI001E2F52BF|nr:hypothetical protein [Acinetobacter pittii]MDP7845786.1 hypothetical protein [Acinetobacter pittii]MDP7869948.1 hypothetical protein [Acinetobacter pittii]UFN54570.1 hypothetical protein LPS07_05510 [Acinetobacter pittii]
MDKCREEFEKQRYWIGLFRTGVDFDVTLGEFGRYISNGTKSTDAMDLESFNEKWEAWANCWQHQQAKVDELEGKLKQAYEDVDTFAEAHERECGFKAQLAKDKAELQKRVDSVTYLIRGLRAEFDLWMDVECPQVERQIELLEQALKGECRHESDGTNRLSLPPKTKCKKCGEFYSTNVLKGEG